MDHNDHVNLLKPAKLPPGGSWADLGAGSGAFTLALRELVGPEADIHAVDKDRTALRELQQAYQARFGDPSRLQLLPADFTRRLELPPLNGIVMANSLHFYKNPKLDADREARGARGEKAQNIRVNQRLSASRSFDKLTVLHHVRTLLKPDGLLLLVEYNVDSGNPWAPYPLSFETFRDLAPRAGFSEPRLLGTAPSRFLRGFYSAVTFKKED